MCVRDNERSLMSPVFFFLIKIFLIRVAEEKVLTKQNLVSSLYGYIQAKDTDRQTRHSTRIYGLL